MFRKKPQIKVDISTRQEQYFAGDIAEGTVDLNVPTTDDCSGSFEDKLIVKLVGYLNSRDVISTGSNGHGDRHASSNEQKEIILSYDVPLTSLGGLVGQHSFPFSVRLPEVLPPSMEANNGPNAFAIVYGLMAGIDRPGALKYDVKAKKKLELRNRPVEIITRAVTIGPETQTIGGGCCSKRGRPCACPICGKYETCELSRPLFSLSFTENLSVTIGFEADRKAVALKEPIRLAVVARNDSKAKIKAMHIELKEDISWEAQGQRDQSTRTVPAIVVVGSQLDNVQHTAGNSQSRGQDPAAIATDARADLKRRLDGGSSMRYEVTVPDKFTTDVRTANVVVSHSLCVRLQMRSYFESAEVCIPLHVQESANTSGQRGGIVDAAMTPSSETKGGAEFERTQPVLVPDNAVRADMRREVIVGLVA